MELATEEVRPEWYFEGATLVSDNVATLFKKKTTLHVMSHGLEFTTLSKAEFDLKVFYMLHAYEKPVTLDQVVFITKNQYEPEPVLFGIGYELEKSGTSNLFPIANAEGECLVLEIVQREDSLKWCAKIWKPDEHGAWKVGTKLFYNFH